MKNFIKQFSLFEILLSATILGIHVYAATADPYTFPNFWFKRDDAYYYFKVAQNITEGLGSSFDGINLTNGYHPLWMLICIPIFALARFDVILPLRVLLIVIAFMQITTSILLYRLIKKYLSHAVAILTASFWSFNFYIHSTVYQMGLETALAALSIVFLIYKLSEFEDTWRKQKITNQQIAWLGFISALVMFSRLDLVFLAIIIGIWVLFRGNAMRYLLPLDMLIIFISMTSAVLLRTDFNTYNFIYAPSAIAATMTALVIKSIALYFFGAYQHPRATSIWIYLRQIFLATITGSLITALFFILSIQFGLAENFPRSAFALDFGFNLLLFLSLRLTAYWFATPNIHLPDSSALAQLKSNFSTWFREGFAFYGVLGGLLIGYMLFNHFMFGTSSPVSGQIKRWWGSLVNSAYEKPASNWAEYFAVAGQGYSAWQPFTDIFWYASEFLRPIMPYTRLQDERFYAATLIFIFVAFVIFLLNKQKSLSIFTNLSIIPLIAGCGIHVLSYTATAYGGAKEWYWTSQMILLTFMFSIVIDLIIKPLQKNKTIHLTLEITCYLVAMYAAYQFWQPIQGVMVHNYFPKDKPYMEVVEYLEQNTPTGSVIGMTGGGNVGYFIKDRTIVNMDGLINSYEYFRALQNGEAPAYLREHQMTILFANPRLLEIPPYFGQFAPYLERYDSYGGKDLLYLLEEPKY
jgi:hypothetical protein